MGGITLCLGLVWAFPFSFPFFCVSTYPAKTRALTRTAGDAFGLMIFAKVFGKEVSPYLVRK